MTIIKILHAAVVIEALVSYGKMIVVDKKIQWPVIIAIALGIAVAVAFGLDIFAQIGMRSTIPYFGIVLTGMVISRGSNYVYDLFDKLNEIK